MNVHREKVYNLHSSPSYFLEVHQKDSFAELLLWLNTLTCRPDEETVYRVIAKGQQLYESFQKARDFRKTIPSFWVEATDEDIEKAEAVIVAWLNEKLTEFYDAVDALLTFSVEKKSVTTAQTSYPSSIPYWYSSSSSLPAVPTGGNTP